MGALIPKLTFFVPKGLPDAAYKNDMGRAEKLLKRGADINEVDEFGYTALLWAAGQGHADMVRLLIGKGADLDKKTPLQNTALNWAQNNDHQEIVKILEETQKIHRLPAAAYHGDIDLVKRLIEGGADVDQGNCIGITALIWAALMGNEPMVHLLLKKGADVSKKTNSGDSALYYARSQRHEKIVKILEKELNRQKKPEKPEKKNETLTSAQQSRWHGELSGQALSVLVIAGDVQQARAFFDKAFWENKPIQPEWSHLKEALLKEDKPMMRLLIHWGATATDENVAELSQHARYVQLLRQCGLRVNQIPVVEAKPVQVGNVMPDGTVFAGISPDTSKPMYANPADAPLSMDFNKAAEYAKNLDAHGHKDWRVPTLEELYVLFLNREKGALKGTFNLNSRDPASDYWSSKPYPDAPDAVWSQRFGDGMRSAWLPSESALSLRPVR